MLRRGAGFVCRSCLLALSRPQLPPPPRLLLPIPLRRQLHNDPFARIIEAKEQTWAPNDFDGNLKHGTPQPPEEPKPPKRRKPPSKYSYRDSYYSRGIGNATGPTLNDFSGNVQNASPRPPERPDPPPPPRRRKAWSKAIRKPLFLQSVAEVRKETNDMNVEVEVEVEITDENGLIQPPSKDFSFDRIKREPEYNMREKMINYLASAGNLSEEEIIDLEHRFNLWRGEFVLKVWPRALPALTREHRRRIQISPDPVRKDKDFPLGEDAAAIREAWHKWKPVKRRDRWPNFIQKVMKFCPNRTVDALEATFEEGITPYYAVADVLAFIVRWAIPGVSKYWKTDPRIKRWGTARKQARAALPHLLLYLLQNSRAGSQRFRQWTLYRIINLADTETAGRISDTLLKYDHLLHPYTRFQIASRLAKDVNLKYMALEHLEDMIATGQVNPNSKFSQALATSIISFPNPDNGNHLMSQMRAEVTERILKLGLTPNLYHYTVMVRGLCENNDFETAWKIYETLLDHRHAPDKYLYSTLLNGAKITGKLGLVDRVLSALPPYYLGSRIIMNDLLSSILTAAIVEARSKGIKPPRIIPAFPAMLAFFCRFYKLEKLQRLIPVNLQEILQVNEQFLEIRRTQWRFMREWETMVMPRLPLKADKLKDPSSDALAIMVLGFLKSNETKYQILAFYSHFQKLLAKGDVVACELCRDNGSAIHDFVLKAALEWEGMLRICLDIVSDMLKGKESRDRFREEWKAFVGVKTHWHDKDAEKKTGKRKRGIRAVEEEDERPEIMWPLPWARRLNDLRALQQQQQGNKEVGEREVYNLNPAPSVYSWSILLNGAMYHRQLEQGVRIMKLMREHGVEPNEVTWNTLIRGFARLQRTAAAVTAMKRMEEEGFRADDFTLRAFGSLADKEGALRMMEGMVEKMKKSKEEEERLRLSEGMAEVMEYDAIMAHHRAEQQQQYDEEQGGEDMAADWEEEEEDYEEKFVENARREVVEDVGMEWPPTPPKKNIDHSRIFEEEEQEAVRDLPLTVGKSGPRSIPKPKIKYFD